MKNSFKVLFFLDSSDISIFEIERQDIGLKEILWLVYYKASQHILLFQFMASSSLKRTRSELKKGFFKRYETEHKCIIEIDNRLVDFKLINPDVVPGNIHNRLGRHIVNIL